MTDSEISIATNGPTLKPLVLAQGNDPLSADDIQQLQQHMHQASWTGVNATRQVLPASTLQAIILAVTNILEKEPTLVELHPAASSQRVTVVGDTHGQYHDLCRLFELFGQPTTDRIYIFNGDYVDRGAWGVETLTLLLVWKWLLPRNVYLLRGNHESDTITRVYGFHAELKAKYGGEAKGLFMHIRRFFAQLPLAALVEGSTLILHGGLFRAPPKKGQGSKRRRMSGIQPLEVGTLDDLRAASKGGQDPDPDRSIKSVVAMDVMWSDPVGTPGLRPNEARGCGTVFGPDITQAFLAANGLHLIIRSHEGPDARDKRPDDNKMASVDNGYAIDHDTPSGKLLTLFSAPNYPQFLPDGEDRRRTLGAVLHLTTPKYATPQLESFEAVLPRPQVESYYDVQAFSEVEEDESDGEGSIEQGLLPVLHRSCIINYDESCLNERPSIAASITTPAGQPAAEAEQQAGAGAYKQGKPGSAAAVQLSMVADDHEGGKSAAAASAANQQQDAAALQAVQAEARIAVHQEQQMQQQSSDNDTNNDDCSHKRADVAPCDAAVLDKQHHQQQQQEDKSRQEEQSAPATGAPSCGLQQKIEPPYGSDDSTGMRIADETRPPKRLKAHR